MTTLTRKGQVTIPKRMREHLGLKPGAAVDFQINAQGEVVVVVKRKRPKSRFARLVGSAKGKFTTDEIMALTRGEQSLVIFVDTNVLLDMVTADPVWKDWSLKALEGAAARDQLAINDVVYAELSVNYERADDVERMIADAGLTVVQMPRTALFLAGKVFQRYRTAGGTRTGVLPDFCLGAHALVAEARLLTRDTRRYRTYFPRLALIAPP